MGAGRVEGAGSWRRAQVQSAGAGSGARCRERVEGAGSGKAIYCLQRKRVLMN